MNRRLYTEFPRLLWLPWLALVLAGGGCAEQSAARHPRAARSHHGGTIGELHLFGLPTALTVAGSSVPAGVGVRVYASAPEGDRALPIRTGTLEILLFDQPPASLDVRTSPPLKSWSFAAAELPGFESDTLVGSGYQFELSWGTNQPRGGVLTVVARYRSAKPPLVYSAPATISLGTH